MLVIKQIRKNIPQQQQIHYFVECRALFINLLSFTLSFLPMNKSIPHFFQLTVSPQSNYCMMPLHNVDLSNTSIKPSKCPCTCSPLPSRKTSTTHPTPLLASDLWAPIVLHFPLSIALNTLIRLITLKLQSSQSLSLFYSDNQTSPAFFLQKGNDLHSQWLPSFLSYSTQMDCHPFFPLPFHFQQSHHPNRLFHYCCFPITCLHYSSRYFRPQFLSFYLILPTSLTHSTIYISLSFNNSCRILVPSFLLSHFQKDFLKVTMSSLFQNNLPILLNISNCHCHLFFCLIFLPLHTLIATITMLLQISQAFSNYFIRKYLS